MLTYRIASQKYSDRLIGSGREARWNPKDINIVYTVSTRALACLENAVHLDQVGLTRSFDLITINCPTGIKIKTIRLDDLPENWSDYDQMYFTQSIGGRWISEKQTAILKVPSSIIMKESNYLINPNHEDFKLISIVKKEPFTFDRRIKQ